MRLRNAQEFKASPTMEFYAYQKARLGKDVTNKDAAEAAGVRSEAPSRWKNIQGFNEWLEERVAYYRAPILELLEQVAFTKLGEYKFWEAMALKYGYITKEGKQELAQVIQLQPPSVDQVKELIKFAREGR